MGPRRPGSAVVAVLRGPGSVYPIVPQRRTVELVLRAYL